MNMLFKGMVPTALIGLLIGINPAARAEQSHFVSSNAVDKCQAFTPGVTNTIRNRVAGAENVGTQAIAVACAFELAETYGMGSATVDNVYVYLKNGSANEVTISCTLLPGTNWASDGVGTLVTQSATLAAGAVRREAREPERRPDAQRHAASEDDPRKRRQRRDGDERR